jgi:hypothetical protein
VGAGYFAGTDVSITTNGPAILGTLYSSNPGATDLFVNGIDEGAILGVEWEPSPFFFGTPTLEMYLFTALGAVGVKRLRSRESMRFECLSGLD